jgi:hypothetical protein
VDLPVAKTIGEGAFCGTGSKALTVTLGSVAPTLGIGIFSELGSAKKAVTVSVPSTAIESYDDDWQNDFTGNNPNITLTIQGY